MPIARMLHGRVSLALALTVGAAGGIAANVAAQVAVDASSSVADNATSLAWAHTVGAGAHRFFLVAVSIRGKPTVTSVTYGASTLTFVGTQPNSDSSVDLFLYSLVDPPSGTQTITVTLSGPTKAVGGAVSFTGVDPVTPLGPFTGAGSLGLGLTDPTVTLASAANELIVDAVSAEGNADALTAGAGQTERWNLFTGFGAGDIAGAGSTAPGAATVTMSWTKPATAEWAIGAVSIKPACCRLHLTTDSAAPEQRLPSNGTNYQTTLVGTNQGDVAGDFDLLASHAGSAISIVSVNGVLGDSARIVTVPPGVPQNISVVYSVGSLAAGTVDTLRLLARSVSDGESDTASVGVLVVKPKVEIDKTVAPPGTPPPGTDLTYTVTLSNRGSFSAVSVVHVDSLPPQVGFKLGSVTTSFPGGVSGTVDYSNDAGATWTYVPVSAGCGAPAGYDYCVNDIRLSLLNALSKVSPNNSVQLVFVARVK